MKFGLRVLAVISAAIARVFGMRVCAGCVDETDRVVSEGRFGDYSVCDRCQKPKTSSDAVLIVIEGEPV